MFKLLKSKNTTKSVQTKAPKSEEDKKVQAVQVSDFDKRKN